MSSMRKSLPMVILIGLTTALIGCPDWFPVTVPDVVGMPVDGAELTIERSGLTVGDVFSEFSEEVPSGHVISQTPVASDEVRRGSAVELVVSLGPPVVVPDVRGLSQENATFLLRIRELDVGEVTEEYSNTVPEGKVISQNPPARTTVPQFTEVDLVVSRGVSPDMAVVPNVVGMTEANAIAAIEAAGLTATVETSFSDVVPEGNVISQNPAANTGVEPGSAVTIVVSQGPDDPSIVQVPNVVGMEQEAAEAAIVAANLTVGVVTFEYSDTVPAGDVISQNPAGGYAVHAGTAVNLVVSEGPEPVEVPDMVGLSQEDAEAAILAAGLTVGEVTTAASDEVPAGDVISQNPEGGVEVEEGSAVDLVISSGPGHSLALQNEPIDDGIEDPRFETATVLLTDAFIRPSGEEEWGENRIRPEDWNDPNYPPNVWAEDLVPNAPWYVSPGDVFTIDGIEDGLYDIRAEIFVPDPGPWWEELDDNGTTILRLLEVEGQYINAEVLDVPFGPSANWILNTIRIAGEEYEVDYTLSEVENNND